MITTLLLATALQSAADTCATDIPAALRAGQFAQVMELTSAPADCLASAHRWTYRLEAAWALGDIEHAGLAGQAGLEALDRAGCAPHPNAAGMAYAAALGLRARGRSGSRHFFWVAHRVHGHRGGLTAAQARAAEELSSNFASSPYDDERALNSPYLYPPQALADVCADLPALTLRHAPIEDFAIALVEIQVRRNGSIRRAEYIDGFPRRIPEVLLDAIGTMTAHEGPYTHTRMFVFDPCIDPIRRDVDGPLCLPGYTQDDEFDEGDWIPDSGEPVPPEMTPGTAPEATNDTP